MKQNPFSLYDFMGYFIPGAFSIYLIYIIDTIKTNQCLDLNKILTSFPEIKIEGILIFLIFSYVIGHLLSFLSSISIEIYANWKYGYPSRYLLNLQVAKYWSGAKSFHSIFWRIFLIIVLFPVVVLDYILGLLFGFKNFYYKKLDKSLEKQIKNKISALLIMLGMTKENGFEEGYANKSDFFRLVMHYTYENSKNHQTKLTYYVSLYGLLRTFTLIFSTLFWYFLFHTLLFEIFSIQSIVVLLSISICSYIFFMAYMKFYRRYTLEGLMILAVDKDI